MGEEKKIKEIVKKHSQKEKEASDDEEEENKVDPMEGEEPKSDELKMSFTLSRKCSMMTL